jgi:hypothetical protein
MRTLRFTGFILTEYLRSGRIALEIIITLAVYFVFLRRVSVEMSAEYLFSVLGVFTPLLTLYTMSMIISLGDRPQGYVVLSRGISRASYLIGLFLAGWVVVTGSYGLLSLGAALLNPAADLDLLGWVLGTLPLLLNIGLLAALVLMLSPLVFATAWRLLVLGMIALAFSSNFIGGVLFESLSIWMQNLLRALQALLGGPLVPAFYGFQLAVSRDYSSTTAVINLFAQLFLLLALLGLAIYAFARRDVIFNQS